MFWLLVNNFLTRSLLEIRIQWACCYHCSRISEQPIQYKLWSCQKMCDALRYLLDNIFIRFGSKLYRQIVGIPMGTNCAPLVASLFLFCYERDFMLSLSDNNQADIIETFNSTS